jgi:hypothetical protein
MGRRGLGRTERGHNDLCGANPDVYTGNGQTYNLYILYYFLVLYVAGGGVRYFWPAG